ncbi:MAG: phosphatidate cytidylyltransferase [Boseongicola sp. SB0670_bin_30]|nr:phosphatidate cytidylyltransferase [Boseongicola sp. SB0670_bin_30]
MTVAEGHWSDLSRRLVTGGITAVLGFWIMWLGGHPFHALVALVAGLMVWEIARMAGGTDIAVASGLVGGLALLLLVTYQTGYTLPLLLAPAAVGFARLKHNRATFALYSAAVLVAGYGLAVHRDDHGFVWVLWLVLIVIVSDIMGYFVGKTIGGPKFWPGISPGKTWSGTVAGWAGAALVGLAFLPLANAGLELIAISILVAIAGQAGDVAESALKRKADVKDSSSLLPGHGGLCDRFDSMLGASLFVLAAGQVIEFPAGFG